MTDLLFLKTAFITLFVAIDPPGLAAIFLGLTGGMPEAQRRRTALKAVMIAFGILAAAAMFGESLLAALGIGMPAFSIAGGLLLLVIAVEMVFEKREERKSNTATHAMEEKSEHPDIAAFPLAIPLMAGPGAITATILQANAASGNVQLLELLGVLLVVLLCCLGVFLMAGKLDRLLGHTGRMVLSRLLGILLAALAVQTIGNGIQGF